MASAPIIKKRLSHTLARKKYKRKSEKKNGGKKTNFNRSLNGKL